MYRLGYFGSLRLDEIRVVLSKLSIGNKKISKELLHIYIKLHIL